jgi:hypothetical protein
MNPNTNGVAKAFSSQGAAQNFDGMMNSAVNGSSSGAVVGSTDGGPAKFTQKGGVVSKPEEFLDPRKNGFNDAMKETAAGLSKVGNSATEVLNSLTGAADTAKDSVLDMTTMLLIGGGVVLVVLLMKDN